MKGRIIFVSNSVYPSQNSGGGSIVLYRHLLQFKADGYEVILLNTFENLHSAATTFTDIKLRKKKWFPPLRRFTPFFTTIRTWLYLSQVTKQLRINQNDIVLSILGDYTNLLALSISKKFKLPLYLIYHDDSIFNAYGTLNLIKENKFKAIMKSAKHIFAVSAPMKALLEANGAKQISVLYPIPEGYSGIKKSWEQVNSSALSFYNSGLLFEDLHLELLQSLGRAAAKINGSLNLIGRLPSSFEQQLTDNGTIQILDRFDTTTALFDHLIQKASVLLVFYSFKTDLEHRMHSSFPSKFAEYCHLGIPILIIAPPISSIGKWATTNNWLAYLPNDQPDGILKLMQKLKTQEFWEACQQQCLTAAATFFDPVSIHIQLQEQIFEKNEA